MFLRSCFINAVDLFTSKYSSQKKIFSATSLDEQGSTFRHEVVFLKNQSTNYQLTWCHIQERRRIKVVVYHKEELHYVFWFLVMEEVHLVEKIIDWKSSVLCQNVISRLLTVKLMKMWQR